MGNFSSIDHIPRYRASQYVKRTPGVLAYRTGNGNVYWRGNQIPHIKSTGFTDLGGGYGKHGLTYLYQGSRIDFVGNDLSYTGYGNATSSDTGDVYLYGQLVTQSKQ
jgi:hypothetical protein